MAEVFKVLGQPGATTPTTLYTVPSSTSTTLSSIVICNRSATATSFRISVAVGGAVDANNQYLYYDQVIEGNSTFVAQVGITLATTDLIRVYTTLATVSFNAFGIEVT
jgi:hypothetical protein